MSSDLTRRQAVSTLAAGFALAVRPISAETITTDDKGIVANETLLNGGDRAYLGYRASPEGDGPFPVILVVQEIFGLHEYIRDVCRRLAKAGYLAIAPDLFARQGDVSQIKEIPDIVSKVVSLVPDEQVMQDLDGAVKFASAIGGDTTRLGITGFCWGGRITWLYAAHNPELKAAVAWYGRLDAAKDELHPKHPIDIAGELKAPVLGLYGGADQGIPNELVARMQKRLAGSPSEIILYPDAPHGFHADYRPSYREEQAKDGWQRMLAWFKKHGVG